jgi:Flp pilus assembly protein TadD
MSLALLAGLALATSKPPSSSSDLPIRDAQEAIEAGRLDQARLMIAHATANGVDGREIRRLLADLAFAAGKYEEALARYRQLAGDPPNDPAICERAVISALRIQAMNDAASMIGCATSGPQPSWRSWNARGVLADSRRQWVDADLAYEKAAELGPEEPEVANNRGWSFLLRGDWERARIFFQRAANLDPRSTRIANNLELATAVFAAQLPRRKPGETDRSWAARLNDAGVVAALLGDKKRAIAAFTQALDASESWYSRASNNLEALEKR